jgi:signal transduction histidine kinase
MSPLPPLSVLLVDDRPGNVVALEAALAGVDCNLVRAHSGRDALKLVLAQDFAVILLDVYMPTMDGFETARMIRARERSQSTPIIFLTAYAPDATQMKVGYRLGAIDYIAKPFDPYVLRAKVTFFVEMFRKTAALEQRTAELTHVTADLILREAQVIALNAQLEERVIERTTALEAARSDREAEAKLSAGRASVLAEVSGILVENFTDHGPMLRRVAHIAAAATDSACVIQLIAVDGGDAGLLPLAVDHADGTVRAELTRVLNGPQTIADSLWHDLDQTFLEAHPLRDVLSVPMLARTGVIGMLSLGRFGFGAPLFSNSERRLSKALAARVALAVENARLYENARAAIELRDNFLTIAAHELKTPLTTIQGYSQLLSHQLKHGLGQDTVPVRRSARMIEERTKHLARLVEQILDVSRIVASRMQINKDVTDVAELMRDLVAGFESGHPAREFRLVLPERMQALVDPVRLEQVMANLIDNAARYSPDGGAIDITLQPEEPDWIALSVRDRGLGIPEEHRAHIFDRFHQAHAVAFRSGMGLGLHISREIVLLHGGTISVAFPADGGSQFTVRVPRTAEP